MKTLFLFAVLACFVHAGPVEDLAPNCWYEVPNSHMDAVAYSGPISLIGNISCVMSCWAGGAFDTKRNRLYVTGGGHNGYSGTEIYAFDVDDLAWSRLDDPVPTGTGTNGECPADPDATPCATHTYDGVDYIPDPIDRFIEVSFPLHMVAWLYDPAATTWYKKSQYPCDDPGLYWDANPTGALSAYDPNRNLFWWKSSYMGDLAYYDPARDRWRCYGKDIMIGYYKNMTMDPKREKLVAVGHANEQNEGTVNVWDVSDTSASALKLTIQATSGDKTLEGTSSPGLDYDPVVDRIVGWSGGASVYTLDADSWTWTRVSPAAANTVTPTNPNQWGTWGRFRYVPSKNVYVLANNTNENVFIYRLTAGSTAAEARRLLAVPGLKAYPNPARAGQVVRFSGQGPVQVYNIAGQRVFAGKAAWKTAGMPTGIYLVRETGNRRTVSQKIMVQN